MQGLFYFFHHRFRCDSRQASVVAISAGAFQMINQRGKTVCVVVKLKNRIDGHKASISEDFQTLKDVVLQRRQNDCIHQWVVNKIKSIYTRLNDDYKDCQFEYEGWIK